MINPEWLKLYKGMVLLQTMVVLGHNVMKALFDQMDNFVSRLFNFANSAS